MKKSLRFFGTLFDLFFPNLCVVCSDSLMQDEELMCLHCIHSIPRTNYHLLIDNPVEKRFWGKVSVFRGTSFFYFQKGSPYRKLLHELKYKGNKEIGEKLGRIAAIDLMQSDDFQTIDLILPVPLHPAKLKKRGYNQSEYIANGLSKVLGKPVENNLLIRIRENETQTKKNVFERFENTFDIFKCNSPEKLKGKHILLVDDVLTTGSTLEACVCAIQQAPEVRVSIFTLAIA